MSLHQAAQTLQPVTIGPATLFCGDAYQIRPTLGRFDVDCMDPPYLFNNSGGGAFRKARGASDQIVAEGLDQGFDHTVINPLLCGSTIVFCHNDQLADLLTFLRGIFHRAVVCFWEKTNPTPHRNKNYIASTEPYIHAWNEGFHPVGHHVDMYRSIRCGSLPSKTFNHATVKPAKLMDKIMRNANGETVCDPFMGTGSTGIAALKAGKRFWGIEKNETHFATAVKRITAAWQDMEVEAA